MADFEIRGTDDYFQYIARLGSAFTSERVRYFCLERFAIQGPCGRISRPEAYNSALYQVGGARIQLIHRQHRKVKIALAAVLEAQPELPRHQSLLRSGRGESQISTRNLRLPLFSIENPELKFVYADRTRRILQLC